MSDKNNVPLHDELPGDANTHLGPLPTAQAGEVVDVRTIAPPQRHPLIFTTFERLAPGESFTLVNDHDPKPLYYQFAAERAGEFTWEYMDKGPKVWSVRIGKAE